MVEDTITSMHHCTYTTASHCPPSAPMAPVPYVLATQYRGDPLKTPTEPQRHETLLVEEKETHGELHPRPKELSVPITYGESKPSP